MQARSKEEVAQLQARCDEFWHHLEPTQYARDKRYLSQGLEWMQMEEHQPQSAATSNGRVGTGDTTLIERVEPSSFGAADGRLFVHLSSSKTYCMSWRSLEDKVLMFRWRSQNK